MYDGLNIRWRETPPDRGLMALALSELASFHQHWPDTVQCDILIERTPDATGEAFSAHIDIGFGKGVRLRGKRVQAAAQSMDPPRALRRAFQQLRDQVLPHQPSQAA